MAERKAGLETYLNNLIRNDKFRDSAALQTFLEASTTTETDKGFSLEDAVPSTLSRKAALAAQEEIAAAASLIAAAYYPDWSADSIPPESLDYSKFDILFFGELRWMRQQKPELTALQRLLRQTRRLESAGTAGPHLS